jgi:uncharacterized membrane protein YphA (DoxX/SURF4 family)
MTLMQTGRSTNSSKGMTLAVNICRVLVGLLFIFSGLVKANDPHGLSYKMQEFFEVWGVKGFDSWTLTLSVLMNAFEIIAGVALLIGWQIRIFIWLLLLLIVFFTFLTGYTFYTGKPTNCGCFGDCLPITAQTSFLKDVVLTILIGFLLWKHRLITPLFKPLTGIIAMALAIIFSFGLQWYALNYLPPVDCLPFKKNNHIPEQMQIPKNAVKDSTEITFIYERNGKTVEFNALNFPLDFDSTYKLVKRYDKVIRKGRNNVAPIHDFKLHGADIETDSAEYVLTRPYALVLFVEDLSTPVSKWSSNFSKVYDAALKRSIPAFIITGNRDAVMKEIAATSFSEITVYNCDNTPIRMAARVNPTLYLLNNGTVVEKLSYKNMTKMIGKIGNIK